MIVLDTTILVYAMGSDHALRAPCRGIVELCRDGLTRATTTVEVIQEFTHVRARRLPRGEAVARAREYSTGLGPLLRPDTDDLEDGLTLFERSRSLGTFDAVLAAATRRKGWVLASADRAFARVEGLTYLDPASRSFLDDARAQ
ncbi:MAG: type II toxin-antitoxin system VapC family toxin [Acidimicrobiales bacterium]